jgi:hypothetical protein
VTASLRRTKARMDQLRRQLHALLEAEHPQSVRQVFFRMTDPGLPEPVARSFGGYITVQRLLVRMRREGVVPRDWLVTDTRGRRRDPRRGQREDLGGG